MLDNFFEVMARDGYAKWESHVRLNTITNRISLTYPHDKADGSYLLNTIMPSLMEWIKGEVATTPPGKLPLRVARQTSQTRFQALLRHLIENEMVSCQSFAIAVGLSESVIPELKTQRNRVAFPVFTRQDLSGLVEKDSSHWKETLTACAVRDYPLYVSMWKKISGLPAEQRLAIYPKFPLNQCDAIVTYMGDLAKSGLWLKPEQIYGVDIIGSTTHGPKEVWACYSIGEATRVLVSRVSERGFSWEDVRYLDFVL